MKLQSNHPALQEYLLSKRKDPKKFVLGGLCKRNHDDDGEGSSIRYESTLNCLRCQEEYYMKNSNKIQSKQQAKKKLTPKIG